MTAYIFNINRDIIASSTERAKITICLHDIFDDIYLLSGFKSKLINFTQIRR